ncbi:MAG TPA: NUDIX domain-containing protein [Candidatus Saccharimonadales bacterium]|nr:NUDIX domain-containing protein [Candidatus Saccharimonadales bacterium]
MASRGTTHVPSVYILLRKGNTIAFLLRHNTDYMNGKYCVPTGHVEYLEEYTTAALRETQEEAGVTIDPANLRYIHTAARLHEGKDHVRLDIYFEATEWEGEAYNAEPQKHAELVWFEVDNLPYDKLIPSHAGVLKQIFAGKYFSKHGWSNSSGT